jgi:hypothetical protein
MINPNRENQAPDPRSIGRLLLPACAAARGGWRGSGSAQARPDGRANDEMQALDRSLRAVLQEALACAGSQHDLPDRPAIVSSAANRG